MECTRRGFLGISFASMFDISDAVKYIESERKNNSLPISFRHQVLTVFDKGLDVYNEVIDLPKGLEFEQLDERSLVLYDGLGKRFVDRSLMEQSDRVTIRAVRQLDDNFYTDCFRVDIGKRTVPTFFYKSGSITDFISKFAVETLYDSEFYDNVVALKFQDKRILAFGPNRNGDYSINGSNTSLLMHPNKRLSPGKGFGMGDLEGKVYRKPGADRAFVVEQNCCEHNIYQLDFNIGNTNPEKAYELTKLNLESVRKLNI
jgi:hypothetical protein